MTKAPYPLQPEPMQKSWLERNANWKIPLGCLTLLVLIGAFVAIVLAIVTESFHHSDVYNQAISRAPLNPLVREQIGEPIRAGWFISGELSVNGSSGKADLKIPISGPRGKGSIRAIASKRAGVWTFTWLQVNVTGHDGAIDLLSVQPAAERDF
ncbi:MAG TPA: cytochrome c oxidase assembly factor Coa1 family protein [Candidatus Sulfotelmatobacter sp.]|nr:cytochrome c oxidase assembly factor Coa1 family protein [Candidatus Sulfotelmatobacter sp.]